MEFLLHSYWLLTFLTIYFKYIGRIVTRVFESCVSLQSFNDLFSQQKF
jgi:hypothetical protein